MSAVHQTLSTNHVPFDHKLLRGSNTVPLFLVKLDLQIAST